MYGLPIDEDGNRDTATSIVHPKSETQELDEEAGNASRGSRLVSGDHEKNDVQMTNIGAVGVKSEPNLSVKCEPTAMDVEKPGIDAIPASSNIPHDSKQVQVSDATDGTSAKVCKDEVSTTPKLVFGGGLEVNPLFNAYLQNAPIPSTELMEDTKDPDGLQSTPFVDSRHTFLEMCQWRHYQFDTLRRAKHASLMSLYHLHNCTPTDNKAHAAHCAQCGKQIKGVRWHCSVCPDFELCSTCNTHDVKNPALHPHLLTPYRVSYEGELRA
jgi:hypothetical protein